MFLLLFCSSTYISRIFLKTEMLLKSRSVLSSSGNSHHLVKSRSNDHLPTSQSQVNIQMMSHTLTIREVRIIAADLESDTDSDRFQAQFLELI